VRNFFKVAKDYLPKRNFRIMEHNSQESPGRNEGQSKASYEENVVSATASSQGEL